MKKVARTKNEVFRLLDQFFGAEESADDFRDAAHRCETFPDVVWAFAYPSEGKFYCVQAPIEDEPTCLVTVANRELADACIAAMDDELAFGCVPERMSTELIIVEAKRRDTIGAIALMDLSKKPRMQFVK